MVKVVGWEILGGCVEDIASWEPEGCYCCTKSMVIAPFWFSMEHLWIMIAPFWLSTDDILLSMSSALIRSNHTQRVILIKSRLEIFLYVTKNRFQEVDWNQTVEISNERGMIKGLVGVLSRRYIVIAVLHILWGKSILVHGVSWILKPKHTVSLDPPVPFKTLFGKGEWHFAKAWKGYTGVGGGGREVVGKKYYFVVEFAVFVCDQFVTQIFSKILDYEGL